jgi:hypothetical protein
VEGLLLEHAGRRRVALAEREERKAVERVHLERHVAGLAREPQRLLQRPACVLRRRAAADRDPDRV